MEKHNTTVTSELLTAKLAGPDGLVHDRFYPKQMCYFVRKKTSLVNKGQNYIS